jgi:23S rRNA pseudouridine2605 synthase
MTDNDNWQKKPDEGGFSARRDGDRKPFENRGNSYDRPRFNGGGSNGNSFDKPRRSFGDNANSGNSFDRPRRSFGEGGSSSSDRPRFGGNSGGNSYNNDRPRFGGSSNGNSFDKPRSFGGDSDRPRRPFSSEGGNSFDRGNSFEKPRSFGGDSDRPRRPFNNEGGNSFDRPRRSEGDSGNSFSKPRSFGEGSDRPRFGGNSEDRPHRPFNSEGGNSGNSFDKPRRSFGDSGNSFDRPQRSFGDNDRGNSFDKPRRSFGEGSDRPQRSFGDRPSYGDRPSFNREGGDRPRSNYGEHSDRPRPSYGERSERPSYGDRPRFGGNNEGGDRGGFKPRFNSGPSLPRPEREDGRPRRPRIAKAFDHGKPFGRPAAPNYPVFMDPDTPVRLNKYLANAGICSRREADEFIQAGVVRVNGEVVSELGVKVKPTDTILFHDQAVSIEHKIYILLNKPKDCVTTSDDPQERTTVMDLVKGACAERIYPVGRLDRNTTGVLLLTNDGDLASKLTHPKYEKRKIYQATLDKNIEPEDIQKILEGITLEDCEVKADNCSYVDADMRNVVGIEIHTGQNRVVRRIFESLGYKVFKLDRVYFAGLTKKNLPRGKWRHLSEKEVGLLKMGAFV